MASPTASAGDSSHTIGLQLAMAFGQGAGTMLATSQALLAAFNPYAAAFENRAERWADFELRAIEYARALGQVAACAAANNRRCVIDVEDVQYALAVVQSNSRRPLLVCDLTERPV
jgi:hypothetical protein